MLRRIVGARLGQHPAAEDLVQETLARVLAARDRIDPKTVYDFVTTNDIVGGNSGSPVINAQGEVIGAAFDGNIESLGGAFAYDGAVNRCVVVSTAAITEALGKVYGRSALVGELLGK